MSRLIRYDISFFICLLPSFLVLVALFILMFISFASKALPVLLREGISFLLSSSWWPSEDPSKCFYGILPALVGTVLTSAIAICIALPIAVAMVITLNEVIPRRIGDALSIFVLAMSSVPTVIYGLWGIEVVVPIIRRIAQMIGVESTGFSILAAGIVLSVMITPYTFAILNEIYRSIPSVYREAIYGLGARTWRASLTLLSMARLGIAAAALLALGRAAGETIVTTMLIGNTPSVTLNVFSSGMTIASLIATQFGEAYLYPYMESALYAAALVLFAMSFSLSGAGLYLISRWRRWIYG